MVKGGLAWGLQGLLICSTLIVVSGDREMPAQPLEARRGDATFSQAGTHENVAGDLTKYAGRGSMPMHMRAANQHLVNGGHDLAPATEYCLNRYMGYYRVTSFRRFELRNR
eukprot:4662232-Pyramimonas_sp.AAC.1